MGTQQADHNWVEIINVKEMTYVSTYLRTKTLTTVVVVVVVVMRSTLVACQLINARPADERTKFVGEHFVCSLRCAHTDAHISQWPRSQA